MIIHKEIFLDAHGELNVFPTWRCIIGDSTNAGFFVYLELSGVPLLCRPTAVGAIRTRAGCQERLFHCKYMFWG
jgi:hypothetical protein